MAHIAITSFVGSFVLIRFKLCDARDQMPHNSPISPDIEKPTMSRLESAPPTLTHTRSPTAAETHAGSSPFFQTTQTELLQIFQSMSQTVSQLEGRVNIHQVHPFFCFRSRKSSDGSLEPPVRLLSHCHTLSVAMAVVGFVLALVGILMFAWTALPVGIGAFASACLGTCILAILVTLNFC